MKAEVCGACKFWQQVDEATEMGECRRRPPRGFPVPIASPRALAFPAARQFQAIAVFPPTSATAWCGEFSEGANE